MFDEPATLAQYPLPERQVNIRVIEMVKKIQDKNWIRLQICVYKLIPKLETGSRPSQSYMVQSFINSDGVPANRAAQAVLIRQPITIGYQIERAAQGQMGNKFRYALIMARLHDSQ